MNFELIGNLVRLRYKLLWAKTRSRNGKIALFLVGYLLLVLLLILMASGGFGAGAVAVRSGQAEKVAQAVLAGLYLNAIIASVILGFGMNALFAEGQLRRYPLNTAERFAARHIIGIADPYWFLFLALELGLAVGLYLFGAVSFLAGVVAVLLLFVSNYLAARVVGMVIERMTARKGGSAILLGAIVALGMLPAGLEPVLKKNPHSMDGLLRVLSFTPPFGAAAAMTRDGMAVLYGLGLLVWWLLGLGAALVALERRPPRARAFQTGKVSWETPYDRVAAFFGPRYGPLMAHWLRFYARNTRFRTIYALALPLAGFLLVIWGRRHGGHGGLPAALSAFAILGCMGTVQFAVNQFGYVGGGFRRLFLLPVDASAVLRAGSYTFVLLASVLIVAGTAAFALYSPFPYDARMLILLVSAAAISLFAMQGLALWATLLNPRRADYYNSFGNDLSAAGNVVVIGGMMWFVIGPQVLAAKWPAAIGADRWWEALLLALAAAVFYFASLERAAAMFPRRRERMLAVLEGRD